MYVCMYVCMDLLWPTYRSQNGLTHQLTGPKKISAAGCGTDNSNLFFDILTGALAVLDSVSIIPKFSVSSYT